MNNKLVELIATDESFVRSRDILARDNKHITYVRLRKIIRKSFVDVFKIFSDPYHILQVMNTLHAYDMSLAIKAGVNFGLFGAGLLRLGSVEQVRPYIEKLNTGEIFGCLAMTEAGHGSNLRNLETVARWSDESKCFYLDSPTESAAKCWIGNAANHATHAIVFAQLKYRELDMGLHAFVVQLRKKPYDLPLDGITIQDNGVKKGLNGVDNGMIIFSNVRVERENLLDKFGYVNNDFTYVEYESKGKIATPNKRFANLLSTLSAGRIILAAGANIVAQKALLITTKYSQGRRQFGTVLGSNEICIINYPTHYQQLIPLIAKTIGIQYAIDAMLKIVENDFRSDGNGNISKWLHIWSSGLKIIASEHAEKCCRAGRLLCGANGYAAENELATMHGDIDIYQTFEGDNTVLCQEIAKYCLSKYKTTYAQFKLYATMGVQYFTSFVKFEPDFTDPYVIYNLLKKIFKTKIADLCSDLALGSEDKSVLWVKNLPQIVQLARLFISIKIYKEFLTKCNPSTENLIVLYGLDLLPKQTLNQKQIQRINVIRKSICEKLLSELDQILTRFIVPEQFWAVPMVKQYHVKSKL